MKKDGYILKKPVFLIGFMGAGKSTVARKVARSYGVMSLDMDKYIERAYGSAISDIFAKDGEDGFRRIESATLHELAEGPRNMIVSCGGGIIVRQENRECMNEHGFVVHLKVNADEAASRISDKSSRPLFNDIESARRLCDSRMPLYEAASDVTISTSGKDVRRIARELTDLLKEEGILCQQKE